MSIHPVARSDGKILPGIPSHRHRQHSGGFLTVMIDNTMRLPRIPLRQSAGMTADRRRQAPDRSRNRDPTGQTTAPPRPAQIGTARRKKNRRSRIQTIRPPQKPVLQQAFINFVMRRDQRSLYLPGRIRRTRLQQSHRFRRIFLHLRSYA